MKKIPVFAGTFSPPTFGHVDVVNKAVKTFPNVIILCSVSHKKTDVMFSAKERCRLWESYTLPENVTIYDYETFFETKDPNADIILVRGMRSFSDIPEENEVLRLNFTKYGIRDFYYIITGKEYISISSTQMKKTAEHLAFKDLAKFGSPMVITSLLERVLGFKNLFIVVGRPGSGKSKFLKNLISLSSEYVHINTDEFNHQLKPYVQAAFPGMSSQQILRSHENELIKIITPPWFDLLKQSLSQVSSGSHVFLEIPYALKPKQPIYRYLGGKIIYVGCDDTSQLEDRLTKRGTPWLRNMIETIPGKKESQDIAKVNKLEIQFIDNDGNVDELQKKAREFHETLSKGDE